MVEEKQAFVSQVTTPRDALYAEIAVLRGTVAALRATRASAVAAAHDRARTRQSHARLVLIVMAFLIGALAMIGGLALLRAALC
jgi:hypothetical protein